MRRGVIAGFAAVLGGGGLVAGCGSSDEPRRAAPSAAPSTVVVQVPSVPRTVDPVRARSLAERLVAAATQTPLLTFDRRREGEAAQLVPALAAALPSLSPDLREYRFQLRTGLLYADGRLVKASDVERAIAEATRAGSPEVRAALSSIVGAPATAATLRGVRSDDRTGVIAIRLRRPDGRVPLALADPATAPTPSLPRRETSPVATGSLQVVQRAPGRIELAANSLRPTIAAVPATAVARIVLVAAGGRDAPDVVLGPAAGARSGTQVVTGQTLQTTSAYLAPAGPLADRRLRRALARATDRRGNGAEAALCGVLPALVVGGTAPEPCPETPSMAAGAPLAGRTIRIAVAGPTAAAVPVRRAIRALGGRVAQVRTRSALAALASGTVDVAVAITRPQLPHPAQWLQPAAPLDLLLQREIPRRTAAPLTGSRGRWAALDRRARDRGIVIPLSAGLQRAEVGERLDRRSVRLHPILGLDLTALRLQ